MEQVTQTAVCAPQHNNVFTKEQLIEEFRKEQHRQEYRRELLRKEYKSFYKTIKGGHAGMCAYPTRLDTYGCGCAHNCDYCFSRSQLSFRKQWCPENPKIADIWKIEKRIQKIPPGTIIRMGGITDCFQPIELREKVTLETIKLFNQYRVGYLIVTKSPVVSYPFYLDILDPDLAHIQITVTCFDPMLTKKYESTGPPDQRVKAILALQKLGFDVAIRLSPLLEEFMDFNLLNDLGINSCIVEFLRLNGLIRDWFARVNHKKYTYYSGNYHHLPLEEKIRLISKIKLPNISVCEKVPEHYEYWKAHFNPNPEDCCNLRISPKQNAKKEEGATTKSKNK